MANGTEEEKLGFFQQPVNERTAVPFVTSDRVRPPPRNLRNDPALADVFKSMDEFQLGQQQAINPGEGTAAGRGTAGAARDAFRRTGQIANRFLQNPVGNFVGKGVVGGAAGLAGPKFMLPVAGLHSEKAGDPLRDMVNPDPGILEREREYQAFMNLTLPQKARLAGAHVANYAPFLTDPLLDPARERVTNAIGTVAEGAQAVGEDLRNRRDTLVGETTDAIDAAVRGGKAVARGTRAAGDFIAGIPDRIERGIERGVDVAGNAIRGAGERLLDFFIPTAQGAEVPAGELRPGDRPLTQEEFDARVREADEQAGNVPSEQANFAALEEEPAAEAPVRGQAPTSGGRGGSDQNLFTPPRPTLEESGIPATAARFIRGLEGNQPGAAPQGRSDQAAFAPGGLGVDRNRLTPIQETAPNPEEGPAELQQLRPTTLPQYETVGKREAAQLRFRDKGPAVIKEVKTLPDGRKVTEYSQNPAYASITDEDLEAQGIAPIGYVGDPNITAEEAKRRSEERIARDTRLYNMLRQDRLEALAEEKAQRSRQSEALQAHLQGIREREAQDVQNRIAQGQLTLQQQKDARAAQEAVSERNAAQLADDLKNGKALQAMRKGTREELEAVAEGLWNSGRLNKEMYPDGVKGVLGDMIASIMMGAPFIEASGLNRDYGQWETNDIGIFSANFLAQRSGDRPDGTFSSGQDTRLLVDPDAALRQSQQAK